MIGDCRKIWFLSVMFLFVNCSAYSQTAKETGKLVIQKYAFCRAVEKREPVGAVRAFPADVGKVYLWMSVTGAEKPTKIRHIWYYGDESVLDISLDVRYQRTRTWSFKNIPPESVGKWYVCILDESGAELGKFSFEVKE